MNHDTLLALSKERQRQIRAEFAAQAIVPAGPHRFVLAGALFLAIALGVGRFAYTPILPLMERDAGLTLSMAGVLASANLVGYLLGALLGMLKVFRSHRLAALRYSIWTVIFATAAMAFGTAPFWFACRLITGVAGGVVFIFASSIVLDRLPERGRAGWFALFFTGPGIGIALTGAATPLFATWGGSRASWIGLATISAIAASLTMRWFGDDNAAAPAVRRTARIDRTAHGAFAWLLAVYTAEAFAYIIPATFLVALGTSNPHIAAYAWTPWVVVGVAAAGLTTPWTAVSDRIGKPHALAAALGIQAIGIAAAALIPSVLGLIVGAVALGGTFIAISIFATSIASDMYPDGTSLAIGRMTVLYSVGQIAGPLVATAGAVISGSYLIGLLGAAAIAGAAAVAVLAGLSERGGAAQMRFSERRPG